MVEELAQEQINVLKRVFIIDVLNHHNVVENIIQSVGEKLIAKQLNQENVVHIAVN
jgi:hypothetical protein